MRRFNDGYMLGANTFFDHDLSRSHSRLGVGVEYWRDYLKLSANGYHRLSSWRTSPDLDDYQERPANGWDVRAEGWLPSMPQLGGKLTYEKYYGSEVGLFGKDNRKKNPHAITTGVTYTPIPLLTFSAEQRRGNAGASDTQFGMQFNWSLGQSWSKQTDPSKVAAMRTLAGSRYDLVERNNNIVLEYRKKEVIRHHRHPAQPQPRPRPRYPQARRSLGRTLGRRAPAAEAELARPTGLHRRPGRTGPRARRHGQRHRQLPQQQP
ncbi:inverse autotransporter beta domain-containing protein [Pseudomonas sp. HTZ2]|uniref:inverse autotransporter beta domain-containing protein n=1 Tax=Pseudomonas sp. HTZ2 TaxID=3075220 RepID=UPI002958569B|nr:inverse autotransporter beta domain-containing protein [Pseudomonas sp. HTZ2]